MELEIQNFIINFIKTLLKNLGINCDINVQKEANQWRFLITNESKTNFLVEENGEIIFAIQHVIRTIIRQKFALNKTHFILDVDDFRKTREKEILNLIPDLVNESVIKRGKTVVLKSFSSYERLLIHTELKEIKGIQTTSFGIHGDRKLVIIPTSEMGTLGMENSVVLTLEKIKEFLENDK